MMYQKYAPVISLATFQEPPWAQNAMQLLHVSSRESPQAAATEAQHVGAGDWDQDSGNGRKNCGNDSEFVFRHCWWFVLPTDRSHGCGD